MISLSQGFCGLNFSFGREFLTSFGTTSNLLQRSAEESYNGCATWKMEMHLHSPKRTPRSSRQPPPRSKRETKSKKAPNPRVVRTLALEDAFRDQENKDISNVQNLQEITPQFSSTNVRKHITRASFSNVSYSLFPTPIIYIFQTHTIF